MSKREDEIAAKAVRKSTLKSLEVKKRARIKQLKADYEAQLREIELTYAEDPERLKAKFAAEDFAKSEKSKNRAAKRIAAYKKSMEENKKVRKFTTAEEVGSAIVQGIGAGLFIAGTAVLDTIAVKRLNTYVNITTVFYSLFGASMILMYLFSLLHHAIPNTTSKNVFNRLSHVFTFLIIGFGYSAYTITKIQGLTGWILFGIVWTIVLVGSLLYAIGGSKFNKASAALYAISGFSGLVLCRTLSTVLTTRSFTMLLLAAGFYIVGFIFYNLRKIKYMHFIGNIMMLLGSIYMFFSLFYIY